MDKWPSSYLCHELLRTCVNVMSSVKGDVCNSGLMQLIKRPDSADLLGALAAIDEALTQTQTAFAKMEAVFRLIEACGHTPEKRAYQLLLT